MEGNIAATYSLVYRFLKQQSQNKAAEAVKKAAEPVVDLRDDIEQKGPPLEDIIQEWKTKANIKSDTDSSSGHSDTSSDSSSSDPEDSSSSSDSSSQESKDTSSSESEDDSAADSDSGVISKKSPNKPVERDTSVTLSSVGENVREAASQVAQIPKKSTKDVVKVAKDKSKSSGSDSSDSDSSDSDSSEAELSSSSSDSGDDEENANQQPATNMTKTTKAKSQSTSESSSESTGKKRKISGEKAAVTTAVAKSTSESSSESEDESDSESQEEEDMHVVKKRKISENEAAATASQQAGAQNKEKPSPRAKERFQRVKIQNAASELMLDNGYKARGGAVNDYGERAHRDLVVTRGAGFRKEKNKKKRGSYRGGEITMENHSIKFDF